MNINDGISQKDRGHHIIEDSQFNVDELSFHELICYIKDFAKNIKFYNLNGQHEGYWDELLESDELVVISEIIVFDSKKYEKEFTINSNIDFKEPIQYLTNKIDIICKLAGHMNSWYEQLYSLEAFNSGGFIKEIDFLIRKHHSEGLQFSRELLRQIYSQMAEKEEKWNFEEFNKIWWSTEKKIIIGDLMHINKSLKKIFYEFNNSINSLKQTGLNYFNASIKNQEHAPFLSLLVTFLNLYLSVRGKLNSFSKKYFQFYYNEILKVKRKEYHPDCTYLLFKLKDGIEDFYIQKETRFVGGKDENNKKLIYTNENDFVVNKAEIGQILTLYLEKNELIWPKCDYTNIIKNSIPAAGLEDFNSGDKNKWPLFGGPSMQMGEYAELGFAISDKIFLLNEGQRSIRVEIVFSGKSFNSFAEQLNNVKEEYLLQEVFGKLFSNIFDIQVTTREGWFKIDDYAINCSLIDESLSPNTITIQFKLSNENPAITPYSQEIHKMGGSNGIPAIKFLINNESYLFPYSLINGLELENITSTAVVSDIKNIIVVNELGRLDITKPFYPFGAIPRVNSYFIFGNYEMSQKNITNLDLFIQWNNLPKDENGLAEYFNGYDVDISRSDFECSITFLNNGNWLPEVSNQQELVSLFASEVANKNEGSEKLSSRTEFRTIKTIQFRPDNRKIDALNYNYDNYAIGGFVKFSLCGPNFAFGHNDYPLKLSQTTFLNAKRKVQKQLPNPPFSPLAENMKLGYSSESNISFTSIQSSNKTAEKKLYHIHPWGYEELKPNIQSDKRVLLPKYSSPGNLFIGLDHIKPKMTVSVFFELIDDSNPEVGKESPDLTWEYLSSNKWKPLPKADLLSDSTNGFLDSGIILLRIPEDINQENTLLSSKYHWLRVSANGRLENVCSAVNISTQALKVTWENNDNSLEHLKSYLPAKTIVKAESALPGIKTILQATDSFGGKPLEGMLRTKVRVGERLKHKNRAVTPWDYEMLLLENFPDIYKVKCFPNMSTEKRIHPGHVLLVIVHKMDIKGNKVNFSSITNNTRLHKIKTFISEIASGFATIEVRNPVFEKVQVRCAVRIRDGLDAGYFINQFNSELINFLSPWQTEVQDEPGFGKQIKGTNVLSFIQSLEFVEYVTDFSMLQLTHDTELKYSLLDTADRTYKEKQESGRIDFESAAVQKILIPSYPWGILVSAEKHVIEVLNIKKEIEPLKTGIDELEVGDTFVIK